MKVVMDNLLKNLILVPLDKRMKAIYHIFFDQDN